MKIKNLIKLTASLCIAAGLLFLFPGTIKAEYVNDSENGVSYNNEDTISTGYVSDYAKGASGYTYISLHKDNYRVANVKTDSTNLIAKRTYEVYNKHTKTKTKYNSQKDDYDYITSDSTSYYTTYISYYAKKAGKFTVTFDVVDTSDSNRVVCTKTIKVKTYVSSTSVDPVKSITYAGKDLINYYPFTDKTSGKLKVKLKSGYTLKSIEIGKPNAGQVVYKKTKNNATIKLAKADKYTKKYSSFTANYNKLFPCTYMKITYIDKKSKEEMTTTYALYTINKK